MKDWEREGGTTNTEIKEKRKSSKEQEEKKMAVPLELNKIKNLVFLSMWFVLAVKEFGEWDNSQHRYIGIEVG